MHITALRFPRREQTQTSTRILRTSNVSRALIWLFFEQEKLNKVQSTEHSTHSTRVLRIEDRVVVDMTTGHPHSTYIHTCASIHAPQYMQARHSMYVYILTLIININKHQQSKHRLLLRHSHPCLYSVTHANSPTRQPPATSHQPPEQPAHPYIHTVPFSKTWR